MGNLSPIEEFRQEVARDCEKYVGTVVVLTGASEDDAREALHTVVSRLLEKLRDRPRSGQVSVSAWRPYVIQCVVNELRQRSRSVARRRKTIVLFSELDEAGRRQVASLRATQLPPDVQAERNELAAMALRELRRLPIRQRSVIALYCQDYTFRDIADALDINIVTAHRHFDDGIGVLRHRLRKVA